MIEQIFPPYPEYFSELKQYLIKTQDNGWHLVRSISTLGHKYDYFFCELGYAYDLIDIKEIYELN